MKGFKHAIGFTRFRSMHKLVFIFLACCGLSCGKQKGTQTEALDQSLPKTEKATPPSTFNFPEGLELSTPLPGDTVSFPLSVSGKARGYWYFEGDFQLALYHKQQVVAESYVSAQGAWMTTNFVAFKGQINPNEPLPPGATLTLMLHGANPSGLKQNERHFKVPLVSE